MKKYPLILLIMAGIIAVLIISCQKDSLSREGTEDNSVLFEDQSLLENISPNFFDNHIYRIELLGNNDELCELASIIYNEGIVAEELNMYAAKKHYFNHSPVVMYSVPYTSNEDLVIVYQYETEAIVMHSKTRPGKENDLHSLSSSDGKLLYTLEVNDKGEFGNIITHHNLEFEDFNTRVYTLSQAKLSNRGSYLKVKEEDCCRRKADWAACIDCTVSAFTSSFVGTLSLILVGKEAMGAIAVSCINAGPTARC